MKILMVNKYFYIKGGSETYYFSLKKLLESHGHQVIDFSMVHDNNFASEYSGYFVNQIDYNHPSGLIKKIRLAAKILYSLEAKRKFEQLVKDTRPDLVHLNIFQHQLSPSILSVIKKYNLPAVYTAHDLKMLCPNYRMYTNRKVCERCRGGWYINCIKYRCIKKSRLKSLIVTIEAYIQKLTQSYNVIQKIIVPSKFYQVKFIEWGVQAKRIVYIPNFSNNAEKTQSEYNRDSYYLYYGRLSEEKGIITLLKAIEGVKSKLLIVGTGPYEEKIRSYIKKTSLNNVTLLGYKSGKELQDIVRKAKAVILPSEWYENSPYTIIEAMQMSKPVIVSDIGGLPELVKENGYIYKTGDSWSLCEKIKKLDDLSKEEYETLCKNSNKLYEKYFTSEDYYRSIISVYREVVRIESIALNN